MHWHKQVIALKAQQRTLQIFDLGQKIKLKSSTMNEDVLFWKWVSIDTLGLVTDTAVYHWNVFDQGQSNPIKIFERTSNLGVSLYASNGNTQGSLVCDRAAKSSTTALTKMTSGWS